MEVLADCRDLAAAVGEDFGHEEVAEEVAEVVRSLVSPAPSYATGQRVVVDGGTF